MAKHLLLNNAEKQFFNIFHSLCSTRDSWRVWSDFITVSAISLSNPFELNPDKKAEREKEYAECIKRLGGIEKTAELLKTVVNGIHLNLCNTAEGFPFDFCGHSFTESIRLFMCGQWSNNTEEHLRIQNSIMQEQSSWACYRFVTALRQSNIYLFGKLLTF